MHAFARFRHRLTAVLTVLVAMVFSPFAPLARAVSPTTAPGTGSDIFGIIQAPQGVDKYNADPQAANGFGGLVFFSNIIKLLTIVAGLWVLVNFVMAGWTYITSAGDSSATKKVYDKLVMSVIGIVLIVASYTLIALLSLILFGDPGYILNPVIKGVGP